VPLPILDVTTHSWYRRVGKAVERALPMMRSASEGAITLGYSGTGNYSFPLINLSSSTGLQGFLTGADLLVYHIFTRLAYDVRTRIVLDEPTAIRLSPERSPVVRSRQTAIPDPQDDSQDTNNGDDEQETQDATEFSLPPLTDLAKSVWWLNHCPWLPSGWWREMLLSVGPGRGRKGLENRSCMTVIIATLSPRPKEGDPATPTTATTATATARANSPAQKRKRPLEDDSQRSPVSLSRPPESQGFSLDSEDDGYVDLVSGLDASPTSFIES